MWASIGAAFAAALPGFVTSVVGWVVGLVFPSKAAPDAASTSQAEKDRADNADAMLKAKVQGDAIDDAVRDAAASGKLRESDKFQINS